MDKIGNATEQLATRDERIAAEAQRAEDIAIVRMTLAYNGLLPVHFAKVMDIAEGAFQRLFPRGTEGA
jgi:hypothetical protein